MIHAKKWWSNSTGERGLNRVRAFEHPATGLLFLEFSDGGKRTRMALGHRDRDAAKAKAEELAVALRDAEAMSLTTLTLGTLFDIYMREVTPEKGESARYHDRRAAALFSECFGSQRRPETLSRRDWDAFIRWRRRVGDMRSGQARGRPVRDRVVRQNLQFLLAVLNWATAAGNGKGGRLLETNPLRGMPLPKEKSPRRPVATDSLYQALLAVSRRVDPLFGLALVLAHETGHRIGAIRMLRWSDIDLEAEVIRWRGENDKIGFEHETPLSPGALAALERARQAKLSIGDAWLLPSLKNDSEPCSRHLVRDWWKRAERLAGVKHIPGTGWHSLRRKFATELKYVPLKDLCHLGGWKEPQTILRCYQRADETTMREALAMRARLTARGVLAANRHHESTPSPVLLEK